MAVTESTVTETQEQAEAAEQRDRDTIALVVPSELKDMVEARAKEGSTTIAGYVRSMLAKEFNYTIPADFGTRQKYGTDEERKAAARAKSAKRNQIMKLLMQKFRAGEIDLDSLILDDDDDEDEVAV